MLILISLKSHIIKYFNKYFIKILVVYIFFGLVCQYEYVSCMKLGKLEEGTFQNWKYLYYSNKPNFYFEEIINFYTHSTITNKFNISQYRYTGQYNLLRKCYWSHWNLSVINYSQPYIDIITNIMLSTNNSTIVADLDPNFLKLSDEGFLKNKIQYNTNYLIFIDKNEIIEQFDLYKQNKKEINNYLIKKKVNILKNFNSVLKNYNKN